MERKEPCWACHHIYNLLKCLFNCRERVDGTLLTINTHEKLDNIVFHVSHNSLNYFPKYNIGISQKLLYLGLYKQEVLNHLFW